MTDIESLEPNRLFQSGAWSITTRWFIKFLGLISTIFVVRLLIPQDFGIVMKATIIMGPFITCVGIGFSEAVLRIKAPTQKHYDSAFTANVILASIFALVLNIISPFASWLLKEPLLLFLLPILSIKILIFGLINPRIQDLLREFKYLDDFKYLVYSKIANVICIFFCCLYYKNYYGLIVGQTIGTFGTLILSYCIIHYRPRFSVQHIKEFIDFSVPNMSAGVGDYILMNMDRLLLSRFISNRILGFYNLAYELAEQFTTEVIYPLARAFFPVFAEQEHHKEKLKSTYLGAISFLIPLCLGIAIGLSLIAKPLILVYAGEKWLFTAQLLHFLAIAATSQAFCLVSASVLGATGYIKMRARLTNANAVISAIGIVPFAIHGDIFDVILVKTIVSVAFVGINLYVVCKVLKIHFSEIISIITRPIIACVGMVFVLLTIHMDNQYLELFSMVFIGLISYTVIQFGLWILIGKPKTIEHTILQKLKCI
jgi:lipopolysaccharide exporter